MSLDSKNSGLEKLTEKINKIQKEQAVSLSKLMNDSFITDNTNYTSFTDLLSASGYNVETSDDFLAIPDKEWDCHVRACTNFSSWNEMQQVAANEYIRQQLLD